MKNLELVITKSASKTEVIISGNVVAIDAHDFSQALIDLVQHGEELNIDMTKVTDIGFTGVNALKLIKAGIAEKDSVWELSLKQNSSVCHFINDAKDSLPITYVENIYLMTAA